MGPHPVPEPHEVHIADGVTVTARWWLNGGKRVREITISTVHPLISVRVASEGTTVDEFRCGGTVIELSFLEPIHGHPNLVCEVRVISPQEPFEDPPK